MKFDDFEARAREIYDAIPHRFREGVDGLEVRRKRVPHPSLPDIYTLGECLSEYYPSEFGGAGEVRSSVVLYHGSFVALSRIDEEFDWEAELQETILHEVKHHRESMALEDSLEELDYAEDQNFARREGERFDPFFYRSGTAVAPGVWEVDRDLFAEVKSGVGERAAGWLEVEADGETHRVPVSAEDPDVHFVRIGETLEGSGDLYVVVVRSRGLRGWLSALLRGAPLQVRESDLIVDSREGEGS